MEKRYPCVRVLQDPSAKPLLLFSAPAEEIEEWIGIPQRVMLETGNETAGFQRTVSKAREEALKRFFADERNVIQNPLLGAIRKPVGAQVSYEPSPQNANLGQVILKWEELGGLSLAQLFTRAREYLESRAPELAGRPLPTQLISALQARLDPSLSADPSDEADQEGNGEELAEGEDGYEQEPAEDALFDESQITDFWDQLRAREELAGKLPPSKVGDDFLGFDRLTLESYLRPVILVDGQHRLRGAVLATRDRVDASSEAKALVLEGTAPEDARAQLRHKLGRWLPVSLLMDDSPAEHVFQYVVVNQKATAVPKALLGNIISTSLVPDELQTIAQRLEEAKIPLEGSRVISLLSRSEDSPFQGLVAKGMEGEGTKLPWSVLGSLADVFRYLEGGKLYHLPMDNARVWRQHHLEQSPIVADWSARSYESALAYWQDLNGPWLPAFKAFWRRTREVLASDSPEAPNAWCNPRDSNIFNKPSLHILTADFFSFLRETKTRLGSVDEISGLVDSWLEYAAPNYFARKWKTEGVKKDSVGTRRQWAALWAEHRQKGGSPPPPAAFAKLYNG